MTTQPQRRSTSQDDQNINDEVATDDPWRRSEPMPEISESLDDHEYRQSPGGQRTDIPPVAFQPD